MIKQNKNKIIFGIIMQNSKSIQSLSSLFCKFRGTIQITQEFSHDMFKTYTQQYKHKKIILHINYKFY